MLKNVSRLECKICEKVFQFTCEMDSSLHDVRESLLEFLKYIDQVENAVLKQQEIDRLEKKDQSTECIIEENNPQ